MKIVKAKSAGFCFGVDNAVKKALSLQPKDNESLVMLGKLIHNDLVLKDLCDKGYKIVDNPDDVPSGSTVIIRAHGISPDVRQKLIYNKCTLIDCTCPFVNKIHEIVREYGLKGYDIIICGTKGHAEVEGISGEAPSDKVHVISSIDELEDISYDPNKTIIVSQTTFSVSSYQRICTIVKKQIAKKFVFDTICYTTRIRQDEASDISESADVMIVIGSKDSSNTRKLYNICSSRCDRAYLINDAKELLSILESINIGQNDVVGITAGASTPEHIILEVVRIMDENMNEVITNQETSDINFGDYIESIPQLRSGAIVKGVITSADSDYVYVDVRDKSEGRIPRREFDSDPSFDVNEAISSKAEVEVKVKHIKNSDQGKEIILSKLLVDQEKNKGVIEEAFNNKTPIVAKITGVVKEGVIANYGGIEIYIHKTQLKIGEVNDLESYKGQDIEIVITKLDTDKNRLRVSGSHRKILTQERDQKAKEIWDNIEIGKVYKGTVRTLPNFGAFVDIGGVDGLVHITELSWKRINKPSDVLSVGEEIEVFVKGFDKETKKISLGYKREEDDPYYNISERIPVGAVIKGTVVRLTDFGAFIQLEPDLDALCHVSQISSVRLGKPSDVLSVGMEVMAKVIDVKPEERKLSVSIKEVAPIDPEETFEDEVIEEASEAEVVSESTEE